MALCGLGEEPEGATQQIMKLSDQGTTAARYGVVPRTLIFLRDGDQVLLLRGAPDKRLWANRLNGVGGHLEAGENIWAAAMREVREETGLVAEDLQLRAIVHVSGLDAIPGVINFVFVGLGNRDEPLLAQEGELGWFAIDDLPYAEMVDDLPHLLPRVLAAESGAQPIYALYKDEGTGRMQMHFTD